MHQWVNCLNADSTFTIVFLNIFIFPCVFPPHSKYFKKDWVEAIFVFQTTIWNLNNFKKVRCTPNDYFPRYFANRNKGCYMIAVFLMIAGGNRDKPCRCQWCSWVCWGKSYSDKACRYGGWRKLRHWRCLTRGASTPQCYSSPKWKKIINQQSLGVTQRRKTLLIFLSLVPTLPSKCAFPGCPTHPGRCWWSFCSAGWSEPRRWWCEGRWTWKEEQPW